MSDGFVKLWRKSLNSRCFNNEGLWKVWTWCLMKASHKKRWVTVKIGKTKTEVEIFPGQFIFGRFSAAKELKMKPSTVRNRIEKLKTMQNLDTDNNNHYSIISIINWDTYQPIKSNKKSQKDSRRTAGGQPEDTNKNVKELKEEIYSRVVLYLNRKTGKNFKPTTNKTKGFIDARIKEGFKIEDFKTVIDNKCKCWLNDNKNNLYLRPETLFGTKFESYLNEMIMEDKKWDF